MIGVDLSIRSDSIRSAVIVRAVLLTWLALAFVVASTGTLRRVPVPPPAVAVGLTVIVLLVVRLSAAARSGVARLGPGPLVLFHVVRMAAGGYFLVVGARGVLPREFTTPAGWGDIIVGAAAVWVLLRCLPVRTAWQRAALLVWNVAGLLDILGVLGNAVRLFIRNPSFADPFLSLPLAILPTFVVPIVIVSHALLFSWARILVDTAPRGQRR